MDENEQTHNSAQETLAAMPTSAGKEKIPTQIGRYKIISELGRGGMGIVFKAQDSKLKRTVALKVLIGNILTNERKARFFAEAQSMAKLTHENIIKLYDYGEDQGVCFFTMDYIDGQTLDQIMKQKRFSYKKTAALLEKICLAMDYCHSQKIIHRDLKPSNIMIKDDKPYIMDFGIAKAETSEDGLTKSGAIIGSPHYMSPEQAEGDRRNIDYRTDIYSSGMILYYCLTGKSCFSGESAIKILMKIMRETPIPPTQVNPKIPKGLENICLKALSKRKEDRYESMRFFARDLNRFLRGGQVKVRIPKQKPSKQKSSKNKYWAFTSIAVVFILIIFVALAEPSPLERLKTQAEEYLVGGFSQEAIITTQDILNTDSYNEEVWDIWFTANYQLLSKNSFSKVKENIERLRKKIPTSFEIETKALDHSLEAHSLIAKKSLRNAKKQILKLRNNDKFFTQTLLQTTAKNLEQLISQTQIDIQKETLALQKRQQKEKEQKQAEEKRRKELEAMHAKNEQLALELERTKKEKKEKEAQQLTPREFIQKRIKEAKNDIKDNVVDNVRDKVKQIEKDIRKKLENPQVPDKEILKKDLQQAQESTQMFRRNIRRDGITSQPDVLDLIIKNKCFLESVPLLTPPVAIGNALYVHNNLAVYRLNIETLEPEWTFFKLQNRFTKTPHIVPPREKFFKRDYEYSALLWDQGILYFASNLPGKGSRRPRRNKKNNISNSFHAIDTTSKTPKIIDRIDIPSKITTSPLIHNNRIYFGCLNGSVYALNFKNNKFSIAAKYPSRKNKAIISSPLIYNNKLIFRCDGKYIYSYSLTTKKMNQKFIGGGTFSTPVAYDDYIFVANREGNIGCLTDSLEEEWLMDGEGIPIKSSLAIAKDTIYAFFSNGHFWALSRDLDDETVYYGSVGPTRCSPTMTKQYLYIGNDASSKEGGIVHIFDLYDLANDDGEIQIFNESSPVNGSIVAEPLLYNKKLITVTETGWLYVME
ncbi:protein kinase [Candidatus Uabimicrobium sp. HlEnr_7]|uniref:protein kinase domain-containing protein n=1 Tax=Candidatus Uabimicrobium helgolandensis TaxID=3095367 RepID=UPI0035591903